MSDSHDDDVNEFRSSVQESLPSSAPVVEERQDTNESDQSRRVPVGTQKCSNVGVGNHLQPSVHGEIFGPATKAPIHEDLELEGQGARDQNDFLAPCPLGPIQSSDIPVVPTVDNVDEVNSKAQYPLFVAPPLSKQLEKPQDQSLVVPKPIVVTPDFQQNKDSSPSVVSDASSNSDRGNNKSLFKILDCISLPESEESDGTGTKHPQQVQDTDQRSPNYMSLKIEQIAYSRPIRTEMPLIQSVEAGKFPKYQSLNKTPGHIIYSIKKELAGKDAYQEMYAQAQDPANLIGQGGYGQVTRFLFCSKYYAAKKTCYRDLELNIWSKLCHKNIIPLFAVTMAESDNFCYLTMPLMSGDLSSMMIKCTDLLTLLNGQPCQFDAILNNVEYIPTEILKGLVYLEEERVQHSDIKGRNILILKECSCSDILHCICSNKYSVKISDFDSAQQTIFPRKPNQFPVFELIKNLKDLRYVKGTRGYRAPEQFMMCSKDGMFKKTLINGEVRYDKEGPWCDLWSLGIVIQNMILGKENTMYKASMLTDHEVAQAFARQRKLLSKILLDCPHLRTAAQMITVVKIADDCLNEDVTKRGSPQEILEAVQS